VHQRLYQQEHKLAERYPEAYARDQAYDQQRRHLMKKDARDMLFLQAQYGIKAKLLFTPFYEKAVCVKQEDQRKKGYHNRAKHHHHLRVCAAWHLPDAVIQGEHGKGIEYEYGADGT
jgi:hypothetical protein